MRCDAMRCDAMRCDAMRCDVIARLYFEVRRVADFYALSTLVSNFAVKSYKSSDGLIFTAGESCSRSEARVPASVVRLVLFFIILIGIWVRVNVTIGTVVDHPIRSDAARYVAYAYNIKNYSVFSRSNYFYDGSPNSSPEPDAIIAPGYPAFLALLLGEGLPDWGFISRVVWVQALLGVILIPLVYFISRKILPNVWALVPSLLVAISPKLAIAGTYILTESLFTALLLVSLAWVILLLKWKDSSFLLLVGGFLVGITALVRPSLQYVLPFILVAIFPLLSPGKKWRHGGALVVGFLLVSVPWMVRNYISTGQISDPTLMISTIVHGHYPFMMFDFRVESLGYPYRFDPDMAVLSKSISSAISGIAGRMSGSPATYLTWYLIGKPISFFSWVDPAASAGVFTFPVRQSPYISDLLFKFMFALMRCAHWILVISSAAVTILVLIPASSKKIPSAHIFVLRLLSLVYLYFLLIHMVGLPLARYCVPLLPVIFILSCYGAYFSYSKLMSANFMMRKCTEL